MPGLNYTNHGIDTRKPLAFPMREFLDLANNPLFVKHVRSRLRRPVLVPAILLVFICSSAIVGYDWIAREKDPDHTSGSQLFFALQMFVLVVAGGSQIASAIAQVRDSGILDYHRLTPIPSPVQTIGFLMGAPIREYLLYLVTLPFSLYCALMSDVGIVGFAKLFLVQVAVVLMGHTTALIIGLTSRSARGASGTFVVVAMIVQGISIGLYSEGVYGPSLLSSFPVYQEVFLDRIEAKQMQRQARWQQQQQPQRIVVQPQGQPPIGAQPPVAMQVQVGGQQNQLNPPPPKRLPVTFYGFELPVVVQSFLFQGTFIVVLFTAATRRIRSSRIPLWTKGQALIFLSIIAWLTLGSLWPWHRTIAVLGTVYFLGVLAIVLTVWITPDRTKVENGIRRAERLSAGRISFWHDLTSTTKLVPCLALIVATPGVIAALALPVPPAVPPAQPGMVGQPGLPPQQAGVGAQPAPPQVAIDTLAWPPIFVAILAVLSFGFARQALPLMIGKRWVATFAFYIVMVWGLPVAIGGIIHGAGVEKATYGMLMSPFLGIVASSRLIFVDLDESMVLILCIAPHLVMTAVFWVAARVGEKRVREALADELLHPSRPWEAAA